MTKEALLETFARHGGECGMFHRVASPAHLRPDVCAFLMLDQVVPGGSRDRMIVAVDRYQIWLGVDLAALAAVATDDIVRDLVRCGVRVNVAEDSLAMLV